MQKEIHEQPESLLQTMRGRVQFQRPAVGNPYLTQVRSGSQRRAGPVCVGVGVGCSGAAEGTEGLGYYPSLLTFAPIGYCFLTAIPSPPFFGAAAS